MANNPLRYIDPDGRKIIGTNGKPVILTNGKWSSNTPADVKRIGNSMLNSRTATRKLNYLLTHSKDITLTISPDTKVSKKNGKRITLAGGQTFYEISSKNGVDKESFTIVIYEGSIKKGIEKAKNENGATDTKMLDGLTVDEAMAAITGHEAEHTTPENIELSNNGKDEESEKKPMETQRQIIKELKNNKKK